MASSLSGARFRRASIWNCPFSPTMPMIAEASSPSGTTTCVWNSQSVAYRRPSGWIASKTSGSSSRGQWTEQRYAKRAPGSMAAKSVSGLFRESRQVGPNTGRFLRKGCRKFAGRHEELIGSTCCTRTGRDRRRQARSRRRARRVGRTQDDLSFSIDVSMGSPEW